MPCLYFTLFININTPPSFIDEYVYNICGKQYLKIYHKFSYGGGKPKPKVAKGDVMFIFLSVVPSLMIVFVFLQPSTYIHIYFSRVS